MRLFCVLVGILLATFSAHAQDAAWLSNPGSNDLNVGSNWSTGTVPTGTASFGVSNTTTLISSGFGQSFGGWTFGIGASAYNIALTPGSGNVSTEFVGAGIVIDGGSVSITNPGLHNGLYFLNSSTAAGAQITNSGSLFFSNSSSAGTASITNNVQTWFSDNSSADHATIVNNPGGGLFFEGSSTAGNATITNSSISGAFPGLCLNCAPVPGLQFAGTSTAGNATIVTNGGTTQFVDQSTGGNARFIAISGSVDFSNTLGPNGDGRVSAGSVEGSGNYFLGSRELTVGSNNLSTQVSGTINDGGACIGPSGPCLGGSLVKVGVGTLTLSGINTYSGPTTINDGTLSVNGSIASSSMTIVNAAAILTGTGILGSTTVNGGSFSPGNGAPGSSITVNGSLAFTSGALFVVALNPSTASSATVTGTATLGGATVNAVFASGSYMQKQYTILSAAGGVRGTFLPSTVSTNLPPGFVTALSYSATSVLLNLASTIGSGGGLSGNQQGPANSINNFFNSGGMLPSGFLNLFALSGAALANALTQISGETAVGSQQTTFDAMGQFMGVLTDPFMSRNGGFGNPSPSSGYAGENAYATRSNPTDAFAMFTKAPPQSFEQRWSVWASGFGGSQSTSGDTVIGSNNTTSSIAGTAVGADYLFSPNTLAGFALAGGGTSFSVANGGTGRSDLFQIGVHVRHNEGPAYISAALAYGWQDITTNRTVTVSGLDQLRAEFNANAWSGRLESGYRLVSPLTGGVGVTPYAAAQFVTFNLPAYAEQAVVGSNNFALTYNAKDATDIRTELGIRTDKSWLMNDGILTLRGRFAWAHDYDPDRSIAATFQTLPGASFVVNGAAQAADSALTTASVEMRWRSGWSVAATFEGEFSNVTNSYAGKGAVRYQW